MSRMQPFHFALLAVLIVVMAVTRSHHFAVIPDASWALFFIGGFYLRAQTRWAFPLLMAVAILIDAVVIQAQGQSFWQHYCVSPAYWFLLPAYFTLWLGGAWLAPRAQELRWATLAQAAIALLLAEGLCYLISNGSFYWLGGVSEPTLTGWASNLGHWYLPFLQGTALYVGIAAVLHSAALAAGWKPQTQALPDSP